MLNFLTTWLKDSQPVLLFIKVLIFMVRENRNKRNHTTAWKNRLLNLCDFCVFKNCFLPDSFPFQILHFWTVHWHVRSETGRLLFAEGRCEITLGVVEGLFWASVEQAKLKRRMTNFCGNGTHRRFTTPGTVMWQLLSAYDSLGDAYQFHSSKRKAIQAKHYLFNDNPVFSRCQSGPPLSFWHQSFSNLIH